MLDEEDNNELDEKTQAKLSMLWKECFHPKALWQTFKDNWADVLIWIAFFSLGWWLSSQYYSVAANKFVQEYITENCMPYMIENIPKITAIDGTIFG